VAVSGPGGAVVRTARFPGDRDRVRLLTVNAALALLRKQVLRGGVPP